MSSEIVFEYRVWLTWWAKLVLWFAVRAHSPRLVRFVKDHGVRWAPAR